MPRPLSEQIVVITGASSGIGRESARLFAEAGATLVLAARGHQALETLADEVHALGGRALVVPTDVSDPKQVEALADAAIARFGRIDTWINNAAISVYGSFLDLTLEEQRRVMDVTYWGALHGFRAAIPRMAATGGTIITVSSAEAEVAMPLQSAYSAAKHALRGLSGAVRIELLHDRVPIRVTDIKPASVDTPFYGTVKTKLGVAPRPVWPVYDPIVVARQVVKAATHARREVLVGGAAQGIVALNTLAPRLTDRLLALVGYPMQRSRTPKSADAPGNAQRPIDGAGASRATGKGWKVSWVMWLEEHKAATAAGTAIAAAAGWALRRRR